MRLIYFLLIVMSVYFITKMINVVHVDSLPDDQRRELRERSKFRSDYLSNHLKLKKDQDESKTIQIQSDSVPLKEGFTFEQNAWIKNTDIYSSSQKNSRNYKKDYFDMSTSTIMELPRANELFILIRSEYIDTTYSNNKYKFNLANLPVTSRTPSTSTYHSDKKYIKLVKREIMMWNNIFPKYYNTDKDLIQIKDFKPTYIAETEYEFVLKADVKLVYRMRSMHFRIEYYGQLIKGLDFINGEKNTYDMKLIGIDAITKSDFDSQLRPNQRGNISSFITMEEQLKYVDAVNKSHK